MDKRIVAKEYYMVRMPSARGPAYHEVYLEVLSDHAKEQVLILTEKQSSDIVWE